MNEVKIKANSNWPGTTNKKLIKVGNLESNVSGSANMVVDDLQVEQLEVQHQRLRHYQPEKGNAKEGEYSITSSGEIMAFGVDVPELSCKMTGNGTMEVHPTNNLKANVVGKGKIRYKGPTAVQQKVIGKGSVEEVK